MPQIEEWAMLAEETELFQSEGDYGDERSIQQDKDEEKRQIKAAKKRAKEAKKRAKKAKKKAKEEERKYFYFAITSTTSALNRV